VHVENEYGVKVGQQQKQQQQHRLFSTSPCKMKREPDEVHKVQILHVDESKIKMNPYTLCPLWLNTLNSECERGKGKY
jgi:hypothetical protein